MNAPFASLSWLQRYGLIFLALLASAEFVYRGPIRALHAQEFNDFSTSYVSARLWLHGSDPYNPGAFVNSWTAAGGDPSWTSGSPTNTRPAYPPTLMPLVAPLAGLPWRSAALAFSCLSLVLFPGMLWALMRLYGIDWASAQGLMLVAYALALAPWHTALAVSSPSAIAIELAIIGAALSAEDAGGILTGLSFCLKPQIGIWFLLFQVAVKQWKRAGWGVATFAGSAAIALWRMPHTWLASYAANLQYFQAPDSVNDFRTANPVRFDLLNAQVPLYFLTHSAPIANWIACALTLSLLYVWWRKRRDVATLALISLLPFYQRIYNAGLVVLAIAWGISQFRQRTGKLVLIVSAMFLFPGSALLQTAHGDRWISDFVWQHSILLNLFLGPQGTWAIFALILIFLQARNYSCEARVPEVARYGGPDRPDSADAMAGIPAVGTS